MDNSNVFCSLLPSAPPPPSYEESVNSCRAPSDDDTCIAFSVTTDFEQRTVRADRKSVLESNTEFARLLTGGALQCTNGLYEIRCKTVSSFELYLRFLETNFVKFPNVTDAQDVLELCIQFPNIELLKRAVTYLDFHIGQSVIPLYRLLKSCNNNVSLPSPVKTSCCKATPERLTTSEHYIAALQENCLVYIDKNAEKVFKQDEMLELRFEELSQILQRETLELNSELILVELLANWSWRQCEKRRMDLTDENRRAVLGALCYTPRYLAMPSKHFSQLFERVHLLDEAEEQLVQTVYKGGRKALNLTTEQVQMIENFKRYRPYNKKPRPIHLSDRSHPKKSRRAGTDFYAKKTCSLGDCFYYTFCICFN